MPRKVLVYQDYIHNNGLLYRQLTKSLGHDRVRFCDADDILAGCLTPEDVACLVMPGGEDLYYVEKLNGAGNRAIRDFVMRGGRYLGICAGAYYGCRSLDWAGDVPDMAIQGMRELGFFPGKATGPIRDFAADVNPFRPIIAAVPLVYDDGVVQAETIVPYENGPLFLPETQEGFTILARYASLPDSPAAIVQIPCGHGFALLSGPHIEEIGSGSIKKLYRHHNTHYSYDTAVYEKIKRQESSQETIWHAVLQKIAA